MDVASELVMAPDGSGMVELTSLHDGVTSAYHRATSSSTTAAAKPNRPAVDASTVPPVQSSPLNQDELGGVPLSLASRTLSIEQPYLEPREAISSTNTAPTTVFSRFFSNSLTSPASSSRYMSIPSTDTTIGVDPVASVRRPFTRRGSVAGGGLMTAGLLAELDDSDAASSTRIINPGLVGAAISTVSEALPAETLPSTYQRSSAAAANSASHPPSLPTQIKHRIKHYAPNVIPIVKSKRNMVIVGAVLRSDLQRSLKELKRVIDIANTPPVCSTSSRCVHMARIHV